MSDPKYAVAYHAFDTTAATIPGFDVTAALRQSVSDKTMALKLTAEFLCINSMFRCLIVMIQEVRPHSKNIASLISIRAQNLQNMFQLIEWSSYARMNSTQSTFVLM
jgi:hypothetical protein